MVKLEIPGHQFNQAWAWIHKNNTGRWSSRRLPRVVYRSLDGAGVTETYEFTFHKNRDALMLKLILE